LKEAAPAALVAQAKTKPPPKPRATPKPKPIAAPIAPIAPIAPNPVHVAAVATEPEKKKPGRKPKIQLIVKDK
jgi:hypothetical protein